MKIAVLLILSFLAADLMVTPAKAEDVDLQLVLSVDVSSSVNYDEFGLQMRGYASAFRDEQVHAAIVSGPHKKISVAMTHWAGLEEQKLVLDWNLITNAEEAVAFAEKIENTPRAFAFGGTAIGPALAHAFSQFKLTQDKALRRIIDVSGDGEISVGTMPNGIRDRIVAHGVTINGLPILNEVPDLDKYFLKNVVGGGGSFIEVSQDYGDFTRAIAKKLAREIGGHWYGV